MPIKIIFYAYKKKSLSLWKNTALSGRWNGCCYRQRRRQRTVQAGSLYPDGHGQPG